MPKFKVTNPDGTVITVNAPEGATAADAAAYAKSIYKPKPMPDEEGLDLGSITGPRTRTGAGRALAEGFLQGATAGLPLLADDTLIARDKGELARNRGPQAIGGALGAAVGLPSLPSKLLFGGLLGGSRMAAPFLRGIFSGFRSGGRRVRPRTTPRAT